MQKHNQDKRHYIDKISKKFIKTEVGGTAPPNSEQVPYAPNHAEAVWNGTSWDEPINVLTREDFDDIGKLKKEIEDLRLLINSKERK